MVTLTWTTVSAFKAIDMLTSWYAGTRSDTAQGNDILVVIYEGH